MPWSPWRPAATAALGDAGRHAPPEGGRPEPQAQQAAASRRSREAAKARLPTCRSSCCRSTTSTATSSRPAGSSGRNVDRLHSIDHKTGKPVDADHRRGRRGVPRHPPRRRRRKGHPNSLTVAAGDLIGASPLLSAAFHDEPTHRGAERARASTPPPWATTSSTRATRSSSGWPTAAASTTATARTTRTPAPTDTFAGADFDYLAANVRYAGTDQTILPPYAIKKVHGAKIGFIGMTLKDTPDIVTASGVAGLEFNDEVRDRQRARAGAQAPGRQRDRGADPPGRHPEQAARGPTRRRQGLRRQPDLRLHLRQGRHPRRRARRSCRSPSNLDPAIDMVVSGHTHQPYVCDVPDPQGQPPPGHLGLVVRPAVHRDQPDLRPPHARHRPQLGRRAPTSRSPATSPATRPQTALIAQLQGAGRARSPARSLGTDHHRRHRHAQRRGRERRSAT